MYKILKPKQILLKAYLRESTSKDELLAFKEDMQTLLNQINVSESEEFNKNLVVRFFSNNLYRNNSYLINTYNRTDLAIYSGMDTPNQHPVVLFEFKKPTGQDMVTTNDLKKKSLYELVLYYIREEEQKKNTDIKHLIITNCWEYFIFEKKHFYRYFAKDERFVQQVLKADAGNDKTDYIYDQIIKPKVETVASELQFTHIDLRSFEHSIKKDIS